MHEFKQEEVANNDDLSDPQNLDELTKHLEAKILAIRERENELSIAEENLENERQQIIDTAEYLKKAHLDVEEQKMIYEKENLETKEKLNKQFLKLESGIRLLSTKEAEVQAFKKKVDEKENMLKLKEADLNMKLSAVNSHIS